MNCFFCDIQAGATDKKILENDYFFSRFDLFPVTPGHTEIVLKKHAESFFDLTAQEVSDMYDLIGKTKCVIDEQFHPDAYNIGVNDGIVAGRTIDHLHIHLIPRYVGDVENPRGGVRNIIPGKGNYVDMSGAGRRKYNKLVRDKIPKIIRKKGEVAITHIADDAEYWLKLKEKLLEEVQEFQKDENIGELADILEVLDAIIDFKKFDRGEAQQVKAKKAEERGAFKERIILDES